MPSDGKLLEALGRSVADELGAGPDPKQRAAQRRSFRATVLATRPRRRALWLAAAASAAAAALAVAYVQWRHASVGYWVGAEARSGRPDGWLRADPRQPLDVRFADGTQVELGPASAARVVTSTRRMIRVALTGGTLRARVGAEGRGRFAVDAGPYRVIDLGTEFTVRWETEPRTIEVGVAVGTVLVQGGSLADEGLRVLAPQRLRIDGRSGQMTLDTLEPRPAVPRVESPPAAATPAPPPAETPPAAAASAPAEPATESGAPVALERPRAAPRPRPRSTWQDLYDRRDFGGAVAAAQRTGVKKLLRTLDAEELRELADAARYAHRADVASQVLLAMRRRFPASQTSTQAAFLLGRLAMEERHRPRVAARWFATYLREAPAGSLAEEALGRRIDACLKAGLKDEAKEAAAQYLERYPGGLFRALARSVH